MQKMMEKNRNWEAQAQQLQAQLKEEKKRNKAMVPTRAETAPQPAPNAPPPKKLDPIVRPTNAAPGKTRAKPMGGGPLTASPTYSDGAPLSHLHAPGAPSSPRSTLLSRPTFEGGGAEQRPITAPEVMDPASQLLRSGHLPPIQRPAQPSASLVKQPLPMDMGTFGRVGGGGGGLGGGGGGSRGGLLHQTISPRKGVGRGGAEGAAMGTLRARDVRKALGREEGDDEVDGDEEAHPSGGSVRYMGDAKAVLAEEERVLQMMGSKGGFAFHSRRGEEGPDRRRLPRRGSSLSQTASDGHDAPPSRHAQRGHAHAHKGHGDGDDDHGDDEGSSVTFSMEQLEWFTSIQLITARQGRCLWAFLTGCDADDVPIEHVVPEGYEDVASVRSYGDEGEEAYPDDDEEGHHDDDGGYGDDGDVHDDDAYDEDEYEAESSPMPLQHTRSPVPPSSSVDQSQHHRRPVRQRAPSYPTA